jgi:outer membrane immunogenic protein
VTAGLAVGEHKFTQDIFHQGNSFGTPFIYNEAASFNKTSLGWALGAGFEHALSSNWSVKLQYLRVDLGSDRAGSSGICTPDFIAFSCSAFTGSHKAGLTLDTVTAGINYRF